MNLASSIDIFNVNYAVMLAYFNVRIVSIETQKLDYQMRQSFLFATGSKKRKRG